MTFDNAPERPRRNGEDSGTQPARLSGTLDVAIERLEGARPFAKTRHQGPVLDVAARVLPLQGGLDAIRERAARMDAAGLFSGSDWDRPEAMLPQFVGATLISESPVYTALEVVSLARFPAVATGEVRPCARGHGVRARQARHGPGL